MNFDKELDAILDKLEPHERECAWKSKSPHCEGRFAVTADDIKFYRKLRVPPPTHCPSCRRMRRMGFNFVMQFHRLPCAVPGHQETIVSIASPGTGLKIYDWDYYHEYAWDPLSYGVAAPGENEPVLPALWELRKNVPQPAIIRDPSNIDSEFTLNGRNLKHGYFTSGAWRSEWVYYSVTTDAMHDCVDCYSVQNAEDCYEDAFSRYLNNADFMYFSNDCYSCRFMYDSKNCHDCFGCVNLRNKSHCFFNEQLTEEEYKKRIAAINVGSRRELEEIKERFWKLVKSLPIRATRNEKTVNVVGNHILESRNCYQCYVTEKGENLRFADMTIGNREAMDYAVSGGSELLYETVGVGSQCSNVKFSFVSKFVIDSEFVINCRNVNHCFACIGLENQSYCIFNRKYSPEEYEEEVDRLKTAMLRRGEYGEFFDLKFSAYAYNDSVANMIFPLSEKESESLGANWNDEAKDDAAIKASPTVKAEEVPDDIKDVKDDILEKVILCEATGRPFKITPYELEFYRRRNLPVPVVHPNERIRRRYILANPYRLYDAVCASCGTKIGSMYDPREGFTPYCEACYQKKVV